MSNEVTVMDVISEACQFMAEDSFLRKEETSEQKWEFKDWYSGLAVMDMEGGCVANKLAESKDCGR